MSKATFDPARELTLYFRVNRNGSVVFTFVDESGNPYSLIYDDVELNIYTNEGAKKKTISLIGGIGISYAANAVTASITAAQSNINEGKYYYELYRPDLGKTWLTGDAIFHNGKFDGVDSTSVITVTENGTPVTITVSGGGGGSQNLSQVLTTGNEGGGLQIKNIADPTLAQDADTKAARDLALNSYVPTSRTVNSQALSASIVIPTILHYTRSGKYLINAINAAGLSTAALAASTLRAWPFIVPKSVTFTEIISEVTTLVGATTYRLGIYTDLNRYPDSLVTGTDVGTYDSSATGQKSSGAVNITLTPGLYWVAANSNGAPTLRAVAIGSLPQVFGGDSLGSANAVNVRWQASLTYGAMPSTFTAGGTTSINTPAVCIGLLI